MPLADRKTQSARQIKCERNGHWVKASDYIEGVSMCKDCWYDTVRPDRDDSADGESEKAVK